MKRLCGADGKCQPYQLLKYVANSVLFQILKSLAIGRDELCYDFGIFSLTLMDLSEKALETTIISGLLQVLFIYLNLD